jgi:hypothetical protein
MGENSSESNNDLSPVFERFECFDHCLADVEETGESTPVDDCRRVDGGRIVHPRQHGWRESSTVSPGP